MATYVEAVSAVITEEVANIIVGFGDALLIPDGVWRLVNNSATETVGVEMRAGNQSLFLDGAVYANRGVEAEAENAGVFIGQTGRTTGAQAGVWFEESGATLQNAGQITGLYGVAFAAGCNAVNSGTISTTAAAFEGSLALRLLNTGAIISSSFAIQVGFGADEIINAGTIRGTIRLGEEDDLYDTSDGVTYGRVELGAGNDTALGGAGRDDIRDGAGADEIDTGAGDDKVLLDADTVSDTVDGGAGEDLLQFDSESGDIRVNLATGLVRYQGAADLISGFERVRTGNGNDSITGDGADNRLWGDSGNDTLLGGNGNDRLDGGQGNNRLDGGDGNDRLMGNEGRDTIFGGAGNDTITGSYDIDNLTGGTGADLFIWRDVAELFVVTSGSFDRITDFDTNGDLIDLSGIDPDGVGGDTAFVFVGAGPITAGGQVAVRQSGGNTFIDISWQAPGAASSIRLDGLLTVDAGDFVL
jgi:Ca2+-binding RTX toxin-like protein